MKVYAGVDQLTGKKVWLRETVLARGTQSETKRDAEKAITRLLNQVDEQRSPPPVPRPNPSPPTTAEAAALLIEAWSDPDWGTLLRACRAPAGSGSAVEVDDGSAGEVAVRSVDE